MSGTVLTKYLTKAVSETHADPDNPDPAYEAHIDRLHREMRNSATQPGTRPQPAA